MQAEPDTGDSGCFTKYSAGFSVPLNHMEKAVPNSDHRASRSHNSRAREMAQQGSWHWAWHLSLLFSTRITQAKQSLQAVLWLPHTGPNITHIHIIMMNKILLKIPTRQDDTFTTTAWDRNQCLIRIQIYYTKPSLCQRKPIWFTEDQASCTVQEKGLNSQEGGLPWGKGRWHRY